MAGWEQVLDDLVRGRGVALIRFAYLLCGDVREAEDLVQDALVKTFTHRWALDDPESIEGHVRQAVLSTFLDGFRRRQRWAAIRLPVVTAEHGHGPGSSGTDRLDIEDALGALTPRERACVVLRYYEDLTVPEIAALLALAPASVNRHLQDATRTLDGPAGRPPSAEHASIDLVPIGRS